MSACSTKYPIIGRVPKIPYADEGNARTVAERMTAELGRPLNHYRCGHCGFWHVGKPRLPKQHHRDDARLLEVGPRGVKAERDENDISMNRTVGVIRGRCFHAQALAAGKTSGEAGKRKTELARFAGQIQHLGFYEWTR